MAAGDELASGFQLATGTTNLSWVMTRCQHPELRKITSAGTRHSPMNANHPKPHRSRRMVRSTRSIPYRPPGEVALTRERGLSPCLDIVGSLAYGLSTAEGRSLGPALASVVAAVFVLSQVAVEGVSDGSPVSAASPVDEVSPLTLKPVLLPSLQPPNGVDIHTLTVDVVPTHREFINRSASTIATAWPR